MDHIRLYEIKIESLTKEILNLNKEKETIMLELLETRDEVYFWNRKYKELKKTITN